MREKYAQTSSATHSHAKNMTLVSVGLPVRNGGPMLQAAIESILNQTHIDIELIISDNDSDDETAEICRVYAERDNRIIYFRQKSMLSPFDNFQFVLNESRGMYFMWAAHDDLRSADYIENLIVGLENKRAVLAFGDLLTTQSHAAIPAPKSYDFETEGLHYLSRVRKQSMNLCYHFYGLWKSSEIKSIPKRDIEWGSDLLMLTAMSLRGEFVYVPGPQFIYYEIPKNIEYIVKNDYAKKPESRIHYATKLIRETVSAFSEMGAPLAGAYAGLCIFERLARAWVEKKYRRI